MKNTPSPTLTVPARRGGNYFGLGTYIGLAGALLVMIVLFSCSAITFCPIRHSACWPTRSLT